VASVVVVGQTDGDADSVAAALRKRGVAAASASALAWWAAAVPPPGSDAILPEPAPLAAVLVLGSAPDDVRGAVRLAVAQGYGLFVFAPEIRGLDPMPLLESGAELVVSAPERAVDVLALHLERWLDRRRVLFAMDGYWWDGLRACLRPLEGAAPRAGPVFLTPHANMVLGVLLHNSVAQGIVTRTEDLLSALTPHHLDVSVLRTHLSRLRQILKPIFGDRLLRGDLRSGLRLDPQRAVRVAHPVARGTEQRWTL
jgi:hypothetical protein